MRQSFRPHLLQTICQTLHRNLATTLYFGLLLATSACAWLPIEIDLRPGEVLFQDDFSRRDGGWPSLIDPAGSSDYLGEAYRLQVLVPYADRLALPGLDLSNTRIQVEATNIAGPADNRFGVLCRYQNADNYYAFLISTDGYYGILKMVSGQSELLGADTMQRHAQLEPGKLAYFLEAECNQAILTLRINGAEITRVEDGSLASGDVGLVAGTFKVSGTEILFDNFTVLQP